MQPKLFKVTPWKWGDLGQLWTKRYFVARKTYLKFSHVFPPRTVNLWHAQIKHVSECPCRCWENLTFYQSFVLECQFFLFENCCLGKKRRSKVMGTFRIFGGWGRGRNLQWPNTLEHGCYRHYSVSFHGKGMTVQCRPTWRYQKCIGSWFQKNTGKPNSYIFFLKQ